MTQIQSYCCSPVVLSETVQEFADARYYLCGRYFQRDGVRLHVVVWEFHHGPVPEGHHIHHRDDNRANNHPDNLECLTIADHLGGKHGQESGERGRQYLGLARAAATAWHKSPEGRAWHVDHFEKHVRRVLAARATLACQECGKNYSVCAIRQTQSKFCSAACKARALRKRRKRNARQHLL